MPKHNTGHKCDKWQKTYNSSKVLEEHIQKTHITKLHECTKCDAKLLVEHALSQHIKAVYKNSNSHKCDKYQESFNNIKDLKEHKVKIHIANFF